MTWSDLRGIATVLRPRRYWRYMAALAAALLAGVAVGSEPTIQLTPSAAKAGVGRAQVSAKARQCLGSAAMHHRVNVLILEAIVRHESRGKPGLVLSNSNGSVDVGLTGINSVHFPELATKGVAPQDLLDECVAIYVGAWKLSKKMAHHGNTWWAVGAYHSETPMYNARYQRRIWAELKAMGAVQTELVAGRR